MIDSTRSSFARTAARALLAAGLAVVVGGCEKPAAAPMAFERPPAPVRVAVAVGRDVPVYLDEIGRAVAKETVWVQSQVTAKIAEAHFADGADLKKGDPLYTLDARPFQARLDAAEAALLRAQASAVRAKSAVMRPQASLSRARVALDLARTEFNRMETLLASSAVSRADYDAKKSAVAMSEAEVEQAEADLKQSEPDQKQADADVKVAEADVAMARLDVEYCTIRAPIDGRAGHRLVDAGNLVSANASPLVMLERLDPVYVDFTVNENDVAEIQRNMQKGTLRVEARLPDAPDEVRTGELTFLDNTVMEATGTLKLRATLPNQDRRFWPGRFVNVRLVLETLPGAVLVPAVAEQQAPTGPFVYVVNAEGTADMRPVKAGQRHGELVVVTDGVRAGENVIIEGQLGVTPGGKVRVVPDGPAAPASPEAGR